MANQTLAANKNYDDAAISGLANGEDITLAGFRLTINSDSRWGQQAAVIGNTTYSTTIGGDVTIDGTTVWWMAYDAPTGNVPALGTAGVQDCTGGTSGATGEFLGIWSAIPGAPVAAAAAVPATGWIKFRSKVGTFQDNETVTLPGGATIVVNSTTGGQRGWIHVVGEAFNNVSVPRLGSHVTTGDWFELGTTDGTDDQVFAIPVMDHIPAIWVETAVASGVYEIWLNGGVRWGTSTQFIPTDARGKYFGQWVEISGNATNASPTITTATTTGLVVGAGVNNHHNTVTAPIADGSVITAINPGVSITLSKNATSTAATVIRTPTASLTIARRATNSCGFKPVSGLRVRVPNVFCSTADSSSWTGNQFWIGSPSRYEINASTAGTVTADKATMLWYHNIAGAYHYSVTNCGVSHCACFNLGNFATPLVLNDNGAGLEGLPAFTCISGSAIPFGGEIKRNRFARGVNTAIADRTVTLSDCANFNIDYNQFEHFAGSGSTERGFGDNRMLEATRFTDCTFDNNTFIGGTLLISTSVRCHARDHAFADRINGTTSSTSPLVPIIYQAGCTDSIIERMTIFAGLTNVHPYNPLVTLQSSCERVKVRNIGTYASPFPAGSANKCFGAVTLSNVFNCEINRIYLDDSRSFLINGANNANGIVVDNVFGGYASSCFVNPLNTTMRGLRATTVSTGQSAVYGSHWLDQFDSATTGRIQIQCNEPTAASAAQCAVTAGAPRFTSAGIVAMPGLGDQITWTMPYFAIGHTAFVASDIVITATNSGNFSYEFQVDTGSGFSAWAAATSANLTAIGSWAAATGVKLKVRATVTSAAADNSLTQLRFLTVSDTTSQQLQYPYQFTAEITASPLVAGSTVQIYNETTATELYNGVASGTSLTYEYYDGTEASAGDIIRLRVAKTSGVTAYLPFETKSICSASGVSFLVAQEADAVYNLYGIDGSTVTNFSADLGNLQVDVITTANFTGEQYYAWYCYYITTSAGIANFFGGLDAVDAGNILNDVTKVDIMWDNTTAQNVHQTDSIRISRSDGAYPVYDPTTGGGGIDLNWKVQVYVSDANVPTPTQIAAAVRAELAVELARIDAATTTRLASASYVTPPTASANASAVWDEVLTGATHNIATSAGRRLRQTTSSIIIDGTAQGPGTSNNQIQLGTDASATNGAYDPAMVYIVSGTGAGQCRIVLQYDGASRMATVHRSWRTLPNATSEYVIAAYSDTTSVNEGLARGGSPTTITLNADASSINGTYVGQLVFLVSGTGEDQCGMVTAYNGTTKVATIDMGAGGGWPVTPDTTTAYVMMPASPVIVSSASACATQLDEIHRIHGLKSGEPMTVTPMTRVSGSISQTITGDGTTTSTVTRV